MSRLFAVNEKRVIRLRDDIVVHLREHQRYSVLHEIAADEIEYLRQRVKVLEMQITANFRAMDAMHEELYGKDVE
jgi:hypothetical protein